MKKMICRIFSQRSRFYLKLDWCRFWARKGNRRTKKPPLLNKLHLGCGKRKVADWLNVDLTHSDHNLDLGCGQLPWPDGSFQAVVSQQVIEHLDLETELIPLLKELHRVCQPGAKIWLACPDLEKVCRGYMEDKGHSLLEDRKERWPVNIPEGIPTQHIINLLFHQSGQHKNLFDFELLKWLLDECGFSKCKQIEEKELLNSFPEFPPRNDDAMAIYVVAEK